MVLKGRSQCFGRDDLINKMLALADERRCVLLFGGRQAGKTTMLQHAERVSARKALVSGNFGEGSLAVYVNLMAMSYDACPATFYRYLIERMAAVCTATFENVRSLVSEAVVDVGSIETTEAFAIETERLLQVTGRVGRVTFLLDEAARVLGSRFPRAFQDNLFSMLYVDQSESAQRVSLVFSGAQELARFCEDDTSPLGSRAAQLNIVNLEFGAFSDFVRDRMSTADGDLQWQLFDRTGGHAGLGSRFIERCVGRSLTDATGLQELSIEVEGESRRLFEHWMAHFSGGGRVILEWFAVHQIGLGRREIAQLLEDNGMDRFGAERIWHELQYVGVCNVDGKGRLTKCNDLFWRYYGEFDLGELAGTTDEALVWELIKETEILLRKLVFKKYYDEWSERGVMMMSRTLKGEWEEIKGRQLKTVFPFSPEHQRPLMDCMYLGQLGTLIETNQAWNLFKELFGEKHEFQRRLKEISPVRSHVAHFATVPPKELQRCRIACDDLLVILRQVVGEEIS